MKIGKIQTLKGFRDFLPKEMRRRQRVIDILRSVFELYGFMPLETPTLEYDTILAGKYGEEGDKLMYRFSDRGGRAVAMRYDQTVPTARVVAQYKTTLPIPFKRYQIQPVWRADNTQKGRYREFLQCDADTIGVSSLLADAEVIATALTALQSLGFKKMRILINDRRLFSQLVTQGAIKEADLAVFVRAVDKLKKVGREKVIEELIAKGFNKENAQKALQIIENQEPTDYIQSLFKELTNLGANQSSLSFAPTLARGLDYYTSLIFEIEIEGYDAGSICGGGRYDKLIGMFSETDIPAAGFAFGFDRTLEAMEELGLFTDDTSTTKVLVTIFSPEFKASSIKIVNDLRRNNIASEISLDETTKLDKQLKYADKKNIPYAVILGPEEIKKNIVKLKNMKTAAQVDLTTDMLISKLKNAD